MTPNSPDHQENVVVISDTEPARTPMRSGRPYGLALAVVVLVGVVVAVGNGSSTEPTPGAAIDDIAVGAAPTAPSLGVDPLVELRGPALGGDTGVILVFDDGLDGLLYVDPDHRIATRRTAGLQRQSRRTQLDHVGDYLVVGGGTEQIVSLSTRQVSSLPPSSYHLVGPDGTLWLVDLQADQRPVPIPVMTKLALDREVLLPPTQSAVRGVPTAVVGQEVLIDTPEGLYLWEPVSDEVRTVTTDGSALVIGTWGPQLAWCPHECTTVIIENTAAGSRIEVSLADELGEIDHTTAAWSPTGDQIVVVTTEAVIRIADIVGDPQVVVLTEYAVGAGAPRFVAWDPLGEYVYFATDSPQGRLTGLWRSDGSRLGTGTTTLPFAGVSGPFVVLESGRAGWLVGEAMGAFSECPAPSTVQLPEPKVCSFRF